MDIKHKITSNFVNTDAVINSPTKKLVIVSEGHEVETMFGRKTSFNVEMDGVSKEWRPNMTSLRNLAEAWGTETRNWVGQIVKLEILVIKDKQAVVGTPEPKPATEQVFAGVQTENINR